MKERTMIKNKVKIIFFGLLIAIFSTAVYGANNVTDNKIFIPEVKYTASKLDNGLQIYVFEDHKFPMAQVALWYKVGSLDEPEGMTGISHLLEHTMFLGTETLKKDQVHHLVSEVGGYNNADTSYCRTRYYEKVPAANLELAIAMEADRMNHLQINESEFNREKEVVKQERRRGIENDAFNSAYYEIMAKAFQKSPLRHPVVGSMKDLDGFTAAQIKNYYQRYYVTNNAILAVSGDVVPEKVLKLAEHYFGSYKPREIKRINTEEPQQTEERKLTIEKLTEVPYIVLMYKLPAGNHPDMAAIDCLLDILVNKVSSRVTVELKDKQGVFLYSGAWNMKLSVPGFAGIVLIPISVAKIPDVQAGFERELQSLIEKGITPEELQAFKKSFLKKLVFEKRNPLNYADDVIEGILEYNDPDYYKKQIIQIQQLTESDIVRVAKKYFIPNTRTVGYIVPSESQEGQSIKEKEQ
jgi:zinc protease